MNESLFFTLAAAAITVGSLHTLAPDHWLPFAALARARKWSASRTARVTFVCGFGHVTVSAALGVLAMFAGREVIELIGHRLESSAALLLITFGLIYLIWGIRAAAGRKFHGHDHSHFDHVHEERATAWGLFLLFSADPCIAVIPLLIAAWSLSPLHLVALVGVYEVATLATMVALALFARSGVQLIRSPLVDRYGHAFAGGVIVAVGIVVTLLGV